MSSHRDMRTLLHRNVVFHFILNFFNRPVQASNTFDCIFQKQKLMLAEKSHGIKTILIQCSISPRMFSHAEIMTTRLLRVKQNLDWKEKKLLSGVFLCQFIYIPTGSFETDSAPTAFTVVSHAFQYWGVSLYSSSWSHKIIWESHLTL